MVQLLTPGFIGQSSSKMVTREYDKNDGRIPMDKSLIQYIN